MAHPGGAEEAAHLAQRHFELVADRAVDQEVGGEVEHNQEVRHRLQAHDPQRRNVVINVFYTLDLYIFKNTNDFCTNTNCFYVDNYLREQRQGRRGRHGGRYTRCA